MKKLFLYIIFFCSFSVQAQFEEHFTDGGFNVNPHWDTLGSKYIVLNNVLNFQALDNNGRTAIVTAENTGPSVEWSLYLRLGFSPSLSDNVDIVLMSDAMDIRNAYNGYFVRIGKNGTNDGIDFYRKDESTEILLKSMYVGAFQNGADGNLKVVKNNLGKFVFYWKDNAQSSYTNLDSLYDATYYASPYFGMVCQYTSASQDSFWFDDIYSISLPLVPTDTTPPMVSFVELINSKQIDVFFNEDLELTSAQDASNYLVSSIGQPSSAVRDIANNKLVHLYFPNRFSSNTNYTLTTNLVKDSVGNVMSLPQTHGILTPYYAVLNDILINEIMVKPTASMGLPNRQYIELKNTTSYPIRLNKYQLQNAVLTDGYIAPNGYAIICAVADTNLFKPLGNTIGAISWQPLLNNDFISLTADDNEQIDSITYLDNFYQDVVKQQGGWSLELVQNAYSGNCIKSLFWAASENTNGGTPGLSNRTLTLIPEYVHAVVNLVSTTIIDIDFPKPMDTQALQNLNNYTIENSSSIQSVTVLDNHASKIKLTLNAPLSTNTIYTFIIKQFSSCLNVIHVADTFQIAITDVPVSGELILNEILVQPKSGGAQFIEVYNTSNKLFKLKDLKITQASIVTENDIQIADLSSIEGFILPNDYFVLTADKNNIQQEYPTAILSKMATINLPNYDEMEDIIVLKNSNDGTLDKLHYSMDWHFPLLNSTRGISLERTDFAMATQQKRNWHSAAAAVGFATPTLLNSENSYQFEGEVTIVPEVFSPDGDGFDDEAKITYSFDEPGSVVNVFLYAADGRLANHLVKDAPIANEGLFVWDGNDENGDKKEVGIYFLVFERKKPSGEKILYKRKCVSAAKLN